MPLTFPAHHAPLLPLKRWRPAWFDGCALVVGAAATDLLYPFDGMSPVASHEWSGVVVGALLATAYAIVLRRWAARGLFALIPEVEPLRTRSYRVVADGRPAPLVTLGSAALGAASNVVFDGFTHVERFGSQALGLDRVWIRVGDLDATGAVVLQYAGHSLGALFGTWLLVVIAAPGRDLERWYGADAVARARAASTRWQRPWPLAVAVAGAVLLGWLWAEAAETGVAFTFGGVLVLALLLVGWMNDADVEAPAPETVSSGRRSRRSGRW